MKQWQMFVMNVLQWYCQLSQDLLGSSLPKIVVDTCLTSTKFDPNASISTLVHSKPSARGLWPCHGSLKLLYCTPFTVHISRSLGHWHVTTTSQCRTFLTPPCPRIQSTWAPALVKYYFCCCVLLLPLITVPDCPTGIEALGAHFPIIFQRELLQRESAYPKRLAHSCVSLALSSLDKFYLLPFALLPIYLSHPQNTILCLSRGTSNHTTGGL